MLVYRYSKEKGEPELILIRLTWSSELRPKSSNEVGHLVFIDSTEHSVSASPRLAYLHRVALLV